MDILEDVYFDIEGIIAQLEGYKKAEA